jgi:hypothetical protein
MDTHITTAPDIDERIGAPLGSPIRLPGGRGTLPHLQNHDPEPSSDATAEPGTGEGAATEPREKLVSATSPRSRRTGLLSTVAVAVVLAGIGGVALAERQGVLHLPFPPQVVALLRSGLPASSQVAGEVGVQPARVPTAPPTSARPDPDRIAQAARQQAEIAAFKSGDIATEVGVPTSNRPASSPAPAAALPAVQPGPVPSVPAALPEAATPPVAGEAGTVANPMPPITMPVSPSVQATAAAVTSAAAVPSVAVPTFTPAAAAVAAPLSVSVPVLKPLDPVQTATELRAAPFSTKQQVEMVGLVRELGAQLKESRLTVAQMQTTVAELKEQLDTRMTEFDGRLGLAEAGTVLAQSARAAALQPIMTAAPVSARPSAPSRQPAAAAPASPVNRSVKDFRVQGASPGLAVLNVLVAGPGEAPVLYVALGDQVPGIGHIKSIYQRGTTWLVQTDAGVIQ